MRTVIDGALKYMPETHLGTSCEIVSGLLYEAEGIVTDGLMRLHAKYRELQRIQLELQSHGVDLLDGVEDDKGWYIAVGPHDQDCALAAGGVCRCQPLRRIRSL